MSNILAFKMNNGDEVVAELIETLPRAQMLLEGKDAGGHGITCYRVRKPHVLRFLQQAGTTSLAFVPFTIANPTIDSMTIPAEVVMMTFEPATHVENQYLSQTSGIEIVKPNRIST